MTNRFQIDRDEIKFNVVKISDGECKLILKIDKWCKNEDEAKKIVELIFTNQSIVERLEERIKTLDVNDIGASMFRDELKQILKGNLLNVEIDTHGT